MALIKCPECEKEISDKASACIHCGCPLTLPESENAEIEDTEPFPELPDNLNISTLITNWTGDTVLNVKYFSDEKYLNFVNGNYELGIHKYGLCISKNHFPVLNIHQSQIIDIFEYNDTVTVEGNVVGKALVGGLLFGAVGAVVGGMTGVGQKQVNGNIICIKFWDINTHSKVTLAFLANVPPSKFINRCKSELMNPLKDKLNETAPLTEAEENQKINKGCSIAIGIALTLFILLIILLES